jgi:hypothetical protein
MTAGDNVRLPEVELFMFEPPPLARAVHFDGDDNDKQATTVRLPSHRPIGPSAML